MVAVGHYLPPIHRQDVGQCKTTILALYYSDLRYFWAQFSDEFRIVPDATLGFFAATATIRS